jgi:hypothetical protein
MAVASGAPAITVTFEPEWDPEAEHPGRSGFFAPDPRVRTLLRVLLSYPEVRYVVQDRINLDARTGAALLDTLAHFLERQRWLVRRVDIG